MVKLRAKSEYIFWQHYCERMPRKLKQDTLGPMDHTNVFGRRETEVGNRGKAMLSESYHLAELNVLLSTGTVTLGKDKEKKTTVLVYKFILHA